MSKVCPGVYPVADFIIVAAPISHLHLVDDIEGSRVEDIDVAILKSRAAVTLAQICMDQAGLDNSTVLDQSVEQPLLHCVELLPVSIELKIHHNGVLEQPDEECSPAWLPGH